MKKKGLYGDLKQVVLLVIILILAIGAFTPIWGRGTSSFSSNLEDLQSCDESKLAYLLKPEVEVACEFDQQTLTLSQYNNFEKIHGGFADEENPMYAELKTQLDCLKNQTFDENPDMDTIKETLFVKNSGVSIMTLTLKDNLKEEMKDYKIVCLKEEK